MKWARRAVLAYLCAGMFSLGFALPQTSKEPLENFGAAEAVVAVAIWPVIWFLAIAEAKHDR